MRRALPDRGRALVVLLVVAALTTACASGTSTTADGEATTVEITVAGDQVSPSGEEVQVSPGQEVELVVTADSPGEIHVHSDPETEFSYEGTGDPETFTLSIDRPGQVEVESHTLDELIVKLVVS